MREKKHQSRVGVRFAFTAVLIGYAIQFVVIVIFGAPYPAIMMPEFRGSAGYQDGKVVVKRVEPVFVTSQGETVSFNLRELLNDIPDSHHEVIATCFLSPLPGACPRDLMQDRFPEIVRAVFPHVRAGSLHRTDPRNIESLCSWARYRAGALLPGRAVQRLELRWYEDIFQNVAGRLMMERKPDGVFVISLEPR